MKKWLDKYESPKAQNGIEGTMGGLTDKGFNYNGAWGGQFAMGGSLPGSVGFTYARTNSPAPSEGPYAKKTMPSAQNGQEMRYYQEGLDWKPKSISRDGSVIKDDRGQWAHPGEITEIDSNRITMQGVPYPVLGISDKGDTQMMYPEQEYKFEGDSVTEIPMAKQGSSNVKAERLSNFYKNLFENVSKRGDEKKNVSFMDRALGSVETVLENPRDAISSLFAKKKKLDNPLDNPYGVEVFGNTKTYTNDKGKTVTEKKRWLPKYYIPTDGTPPSKGPSPRLQQSKLEPKLNRRVLEAQPIQSPYIQLPEINVDPLPQVEMPPVSMGEYDVSYWDPEAKDWASRTFPTEETSQSFAQEMTNRGYAAPYGNVTQTKKVNQKRNGSWLDGYK